MLAVEIQPSKHRLQDRSPLHQGHLLPKRAEILEQSNHPPRFRLSRWFQFLELAINEHISLFIFCLSDMSTFEQFTLARQLNAQVETKQLELTNFLGAKIL